MKASLRQRGLHLHPTSTVQLPKKKFRKWKKFRIVPVPSPRCFHITDERFNGKSFNIVFVRLWLVFDKRFRDDNWCQWSRCRGFLFLFFVFNISLLCAECFDKFNFDCFLFVPKIHSVKGTKEEQTEETIQFWKLKGPCKDNIWQFQGEILIKHKAIGLLDSKSFSWNLQILSLPLFNSNLKEFFQR